MTVTQVRGISLIHVCEDKTFRRTISINLYLHGVVAPLPCGFRSYDVCCQFYAPNPIPGTEDFVGATCYKYTVYVGRVKP